MNAALLARDAYGASTRAIRTPRSEEYDAFARITSAMRKAVTFSEKTASANLNRRLWTLLATDLVSDQNELPRDLRASLLSLAEFTNQYTSKILRGEAEISVLIDINTTVMAGLRQQGSSE
ncbi:flagellar biosynthesis regulator FlaF [Palleronia sp.]|uniref:flagellar biosynthesis regulator FlaF n=1 Tax=Palleronia sp. TaxID=1940284 RepID=UPI0035C84BA2